MEKEFYKLLENNRRKHILSESAKIRLKLSERRRDEELAKKYENFVDQTRIYHKLKKQTKKKGLSKMLSNLFRKGGKNRKTRKQKK